MQDIPLRKIDHVRFFVGNARQSAFFYRNAFGFDVIAYAGLETKVRHEAGYVLHRYPISGFPRKPTPRLVSAMWRAGRAPFRCRRIIREVQPDVVFGAGGYASGPVLAAARTAGVPSALLEVDAHMGLANRMAAPRPASARMSA